MRKLTAIAFTGLLSACASTVTRPVEVRDFATFTRADLKDAVKDRRRIFRWETGEKELTRDEMRSLIDAMDTARRAKGGTIRQREGKNVLTCQSDQCTLGTVF